MKIESSIRKPDTTSLQNLLDGNRYYIPNYQRSYSWKEENIKDFLNDLFHSFIDSNEWFLGILYTNLIEKKSFNILDGQQRLTTFFLLLKELTLYFDNIPIEIEDRVRFQAEAERKINTVLFRSGESRLTLDSANDKVFKNYLNGKDHNSAQIILKDEDPDLLSHELLHEAIIFLRNEIKKKIKQDIRKFSELIDFILNHSLFINVQLNSKAAFHSIFENINDRGVKLTNADKFKNLYCSFLPEKELDKFEKEWFDLSASLFKSGNGDIEKAIFGFYYRANGIDDLNGEGDFYSTFKKEVRESEEDKVKLIKETFEKIKHLAEFLILCGNYELEKVHKGKLSEREGYECKRVNILLNEMWGFAPQYGVVVFALYLSLLRKEISFLEFLDDIVVSVKYYASCQLRKITPNLMRDPTIKIAQAIKGKKRVREVILTNVEVDYKPEVGLEKLDELCIDNNKISSILILLIQYHLNPEYFNEAAFKDNKWSLEHVTPISYKDHWGHLESTDFTKVNDSWTDYLNKGLKVEDLSEENKARFQQFLGNKIYISLTLNRAMKNNGLREKVEYIKAKKGKVFPYFKEFEPLEFQNDHDVNDTLKRTLLFKEKILEAISIK